MTLQLFLYLLGVILLGLEAFGARVRFVSLGWLGLTIIAFTALILPTI